MNPNRSFRISIVEHTPLLLGRVPERVEGTVREKPRRASADYRQHLVVTLFKDTLESAWERAGL